MANLSWTPPDWTDCDPARDCSLFGEWAAYISRNGLFNAPIALTDSYVRSILPLGFSPEPTQLQTLEWYADIVNNYEGGVEEYQGIFQQIFDTAQGVCRAEYCGSIGFQGNADVAGIGVSPTDPL